MNAQREMAEYRWLDAAKTYEQSLGSAKENVALAAPTLERIGFCYELASRQANDAEEFKQLRQLAVTSYENAAEAYKKEINQVNQGKKTLCLALAEYVRSWLASSPEEKQKVLDKCMAFRKTALETFRVSGDDVSFGKTCNDLFLCVFDLLHITSTPEEKMRIVNDGLNEATEAISILSKLENKNDAIVAFSAACLLSWYAANITEQEDERKNHAANCLHYSEKASALCKSINDPYANALAMWAATLASLYFSEKIAFSCDFAKGMLEHAAKVRDNYLKGMAFYLLAHVTDWMVPEEDDQEKKKQEYEQIIGFADEAICCLGIVCQDSAIAETYLFSVQSYSCLAREFATLPVEKLAFSKKAVRMGEKGLEHANQSGSAEAMGSALHALSKALHYHSNLEPRNDEKTALLRKALDCRKQHIAIVEKVFPSNLWNLGVGSVYAAQIEADLAELEKNGDRKAALLDEASSSVVRGVAYCNKWIESRCVPSLIAIVAGFEDSGGLLLSERFLQTGNKKTLAMANKVYGDAAEKFKKVDMPSRVAECYWKIAGNLDITNDYVEASENFERAFASFKVAAQKIPQFSDFYLDYSSYMKAWSEIQSAKLAHGNEKYARAMQHYERTSELLKKSKLWSYLSSNFSAWANLELAEDLSRIEDSTRASSSFEKAVQLFCESERVLRAQLSRIERTDEKDLVARLIHVSTTREEYCKGRIEIEEARILDKNGDHAASSEKYDAAATTFQRILEADSEQTRKEIQPLIFLCQAWQKLMLAETRGSPILYEEAADLFKLANEHSTTESASLLAMAHSSFCKALESGREFEITRNMMMYTETKKYMDAAANYYLRAGFETASEYAKATQRLFDAYVYMDNAKKETDPQKEAKFYVMAEKVLQVSVDSFTKANHIEKTEQVQRLLQKVREEKELAISLSDVLHAPTVASSTASFATISLSEEKAVGLERFEHADIQAKLDVSGEHAKVGQEVEFAVQIVNVGKEAVFLTRVENVLPAGFQFTSKPENYSIEGSSLVMKRNRLSPLEMHEIKLKIKPFKKGSFEIAPSVVCVDENGRQLFNRPDPKVFNIDDAVLPGRVSTGIEDLDTLLFGGIPERYAVVLTSPSNDERELLIKSFLKAGIAQGQVSFYITVEPGSARELAEEFQSTFYLFVCNPRADVMVGNLPNVYKLKGVESLTDIDIALTKAYRTLNGTQAGPRRACIEIISDVLLQHHAVITRKWLTGLLPDLRAKGFTTLAVVNPHMHAQEEVQAILGLFEGEIRVSERETSWGVEKFLRVRKMSNQRYLENELVLTRDKLET